MQLFLKLHSNPYDCLLKGLCAVYKVSLANLHVTAAKAASVLANNLRQRLFHVTQNIVWLHNSTYIAP